jgi:hypothetical protein
MPLLQQARVYVAVDNEFARCGAAQNGQFWLVMPMSFAAMIVGGWKVVMIAVARAV